MLVRFGNQLVAFDPSVSSTGPSVLLFRKETLLQFLDQNGLTLLWTLLGDKRTIGGRMGPEQYYGHLEINGSYILSENRVSGRYVLSLSLLTTRYLTSRFRESAAAAAATLPNPTALREYPGNDRTT